MQVHFMYRHVLDTEVILEEGNLSQPWCPQCNMLVPCCTLNRRRPGTKQCARGVDRKRWRLAEAELRKSM